LWSLGGSDASLFYTFELDGVAIFFLVNRRYCKNNNT